MPATRALALALGLATGAATAITGQPRDGASASDGVPWCVDGAFALAPEEARMVALHVRQRAADGLPASCVHPALVRAARGHAADMLARGYFGHAAPEGGTVDGRVRRAGYGRWRIVAENIGWGNGSLRHPERIFARWMTSPAHRTNIRTAALREIGVGIARGTVRGQGSERTYRDAVVYVVNFGTRRAPGEAPRRRIIVRPGVARARPLE